MILNIRYALTGPNLDLAKNLHLEVVNGVITHIGKGHITERGSIDLRYGLAMPALFNAHIHILDYAFLEYGISLRLPQLVSEPHGLKHKLLSSLKEEDVAYACRRIFSKLFRSGVTSALIFSELPFTHSIIKEEARRCRVKAIILGRPKQGVEEALKDAEGIGLDSPLRYDPKTLMHMREVCTKHGKIIATHVAENREDYERGDLELTLKYLNPELIVHGVHLNENDMELLAEKRISVAICPRSNMWFSVGLPSLAKLLKHGVNVLLGTDNSGVIEPDMWRELETTYNVARLKGENVSPKDLLKLATVNAERIKGLELSHVIEEGRRANFIVLNSYDLEVERSRDLYASLVKRSSASSVLYIVTGDELE